MKGNQKEYIMGRELKLVNMQTGEVMEDSEPSFVKFYIKHVSKMEGLSKLETSVLFDVLALMDYENYIHLSSRAKKMIVEKHDTSMPSLNNTIQRLKSKGIIKSLDRGEFIANPDLFCRSNWDKNKRIKAEYTFTDDGVKREVK